MLQSPDKRSLERRVKKLIRRTHHVHGVVRHFTPTLLAQAICDNPNYLFELPEMAHAARSWSFRALTGRFNNHETIEEFIATVNTTDAKNVVVALHGYFCVGSFFHEVYKPVLQQTFGIPLIAPEYRTFGDISASARYTRFILKKIIDKTNATVHILGYSLGCLVALELYYDRLSPSQQQRVSTMVLLSGPHHGTSQAHYGYGISAEQMMPDSSYIKKWEQRYRNLPDGNKIWSVFSHTDALVGSKEAYLNIPNTHNYNFRRFEIDGVTHVGALFEPQVAQLVGKIITRTIL